MKILGIDASGLAASAAIVSDDCLLGEIITNCKRNHSETLMPMIAELFLRLDMRIGDIDFIACTNGPGSFTGLRIGASTAMSLAHGLCSLKEQKLKTVIPVPTLDVLAYNLYGYTGIVAPMMDARRGQIYTSFYECGERLTDYMAVSPDEAMELLEVYQRPVIFLGDGAAAYWERLKFSAPSHMLKYLAPPHLSLQRASAAATLGQKRIGDAITYDKFALFYLRKPQAEREYNEHMVHANA